MPKQLIFLVAIVLVIGGIALLLSSSQTDQTISSESIIVSNSNDTSTDALQTGNYEKFSPEKLVLADEKTVVLFFKANWCPSCLTLDRNIIENQGIIPENVLILEIPYDKVSGATDEELELGRRNGVNYQHTLIVVDSAGNKVRELASAFKLSDLLKNLET